MTAHTEGLTEVAGEGTNVGSRGTRHRHVEVNEVPLAAQFRDIEAADCHWASGDLHILAGTYSLMRALAINLDGGDSGGSLHDISSEIADLLDNAFLAQVSC